MGFIKDNFFCPKCGNMYFMYKLKLISTGKTAPYPKYIPMIGLYCDAGCWIKWEKQTPELIEKINKYLGLFENQIV